MMNRIVEYTFFFGFLGLVGYLVWLIVEPFASALALSAIIVTICFPLYERILPRMPRHNQTLAALLTTILVLVVVILPVVLITFLLVNEAVAVYRTLSNGSAELGFASIFSDIENLVQMYVPSFEFNIAEYLRQGAQYTSSRLGAIFAGTASTVFLFFISVLGTFYFFRDGKSFTRQLVRISPLPDSDDEVILRRLARAVRSVATGTVLVALIQGTLTGIGLALFGFERAVLWGVVAAFGALIPSIGTSIVFVPAVLYLLFNGDYLAAAGLAAWGTVAVGLIDNLLGPYLMSRGYQQHPLVILVSVLGGLAWLGPVGFIVGPVVVSLFTVLLELYSQHISGQVNTE